MRPYNRIIEKRFHEWELRHFGSQALKNLAHELVTPERYQPTEGELSMQRTSEECEAEEAERLRRQIGGLPLLDHAREMPYIPGNRFIDGAVEYRPQD